MVRAMATATSVEESLQKALDQKNYVLAVILAQKAGYPESEIRHLQEMALKQMAFDYRNGFAVRKLAGEWDFSKAELEPILMTALDELESVSEKKRMEQCYDIKSGKYLTLRQWVERFLSASK
jgi:hypothetical protein